MSKKKKRKQGSNNKNRANVSKSVKSNNVERDPISNLFIKLSKEIKTNLIKSIGLFLALITGVAVGIKFVTLHLWGVDYQLILYMLTPSKSENIVIIIFLISISLYTVCLELLQRKYKNKKIKKWFLFFVFSLFINAI